MNSRGPFDMKYLKLRARVTKTSIAMALLGELVDAAEYMNEPFQTRHRFVPGTKRYQALQTLKRQKFIRARRIGDRFEIMITRRGVAQDRMERLRNIKRKMPHGSTTLVIFDFPESERTRRNLWRRYLKWFGFRQVQKSVWKIDYDVGDEFAQFVHEVGANTWVEVYRAKKVKK